MVQESKSPLGEENMVHPRVSHPAVVNTDSTQISLLIMVVMGLGQVILLALSITILAHKSLQA
jgi:hypothetical protein